MAARIRSVLPPPTAQRVTRSLRKHRPCAALVASCPPRPSRHMLAFDDVGAGDECKAEIHGIGFNRNRDVFLGSPPELSENRILSLPSFKKEGGR